MRCVRTAVACVNIPSASNVGGKYASPDAATLLYSSRWSTWKRTSSGSWLSDDCTFTSIFSTDAPLWSEFNLSETGLLSFSSSRLHWSSRNVGNHTGTYLVPAMVNTGQNRSPAATYTVSPSFTVKTEGGSGCPRQIRQSMEEWRLVCDCVLWHVPSKHKMGSEYRV